MEHSKIEMLRLAAIFIIGVIIVLRMKRRSESGIEDISIDEEVKKTGLELGMNCSIPRLGNIEVTGYAYGSSCCQIYFTGKEIILQQTGFDLSKNNNIPILPLVICGKRQYLREKYPNNYIANVVDLKISPWNEIVLTIKMVQHSSKTIKLNMNFKSNKFENANKLRMTIDELIKAV